MRYAALISVIFILTGCGIGGQWMNGNPSAGKNIKPYLHYWMKAGVTDEGRLKDWVMCGGQHNGSFSWKEIERVAGESSDQSSKRQSNQHQRCLIREGYHYTGNCSSEYMKSQALCGAP